MMISPYIYTATFGIMFLSIIILAGYMVKFEANVEKKEKEVIDLKAELFVTNVKCKEYKDRVIDLEDSIKNGYAVKVRKEVTVVKTQFTKEELFIILKSLSEAVRISDSVEDAKVIIDLYDKALDVLEKVGKNEE